MTIADQILAAVAGRETFRRAELFDRIEASENGIEWRLVSEADNRVTHRCTADGGWVDAYRPGGEA